MDDKVRILGIAGSLRQGSYNRAALAAAEELLPDGSELENFELIDMPSYNQDRESSPPPQAQQLKAAIRSCDAVLFATPEYNYSVPGVLKNAIDWASRPYGDSAWEDKPAAIMGVSVGSLGTARAQYHLRQIFVFLNMYPINRPEVMIGNAAEKFNDQNKLIDEDSQQHIEDLLKALVDWTSRLRRAHLVERGH